jgi:hypothetical protein
MADDPVPHVSAFGVGQRISMDSFNSSVQVSKFCQAVTRCTGRWMCLLLLRLCVQTSKIKRNCIWSLWKKARSSMKSDCYFHHSSFLILRTCYVMRRGSSSNLDVGSTNFNYKFIYYNFRANHKLGETNTSTRFSFFANYARYNRGEISKLVK